MSCDGFHDASKITTLLAVSRLMPSPPAFVEIRNNLSLYQQHQNHQNHQLSYRIILCHIIYRIISYPIVDLKWQNRLRVGTDKSMQKVKMQSVSDDDDVRKRFLEKPRSEPAAKGVFRLGRWYTLRQGVPGFLVSNRESTATNGCFTCLCNTVCNNVCNNSSHYPVNNIKLSQTLLVSY